MNYNENIINTSLKTTPLKRNEDEFLNKTKTYEAVIQYRSSKLFLCPDFGKAEEAYGLFLKYFLKHHKKYIGNKLYECG